MPNKRAEGQQGVLVMFREEFLREIDRRLAKLGYSDRSSLIRDAVYEQLEKAGYEIPREYKTAPSRAGKGGRPKKKPEKK